ncbi:four helix bundle protein [Flavobacterium sp. NRK F10]|uniref:four helix bundle protein n=1 Tax=Flavobacterium sp. NRK F10 TaxID=2954931 RepID=UPI0027E29B21|nr:four helix bundle protein [Flavobacterium sp. NRK F10]
MKICLVKITFAFRNDIGANVREAEHAQSRADFIHKTSIALKEANETEYWLDLLFETKYISVEEF